MGRWEDEPSATGDVEALRAEFRKRLYPGLRYEPIAPIGTETVYCHQNRGDEPHVWGPLELPTYPPSPEGEALRDLRVELGLGLREAARVLGLSALELANLERGRARCEWYVAGARLRLYSIKREGMARDPRGQVP